MVGNGERRKRSRLPLHWRVRLIRLIRTGDPVAVETETTNLSSQGFYCVAGEPFAPGERLLAVLAAPGRNLGCEDGAISLRCLARVMRSEKRDSEPGFGLACRIDAFRLIRDTRDAKPRSVRSAELDAQLQ